MLPVDMTHLLSIGVAVPVILVMHRFLTCKVATTHYLIYIDATYLAPNRSQPD